MKTITEQELKNLGRTPRKIRISLTTGKKQVHLYTDQEIVDLARKGTVELGPDAEWINVVKEEDPAKEEDE